MPNAAKRTALRYLGVLVAASALPIAALSQASEAGPSSVQPANDEVNEWMNGWMDSGAAGDAAAVQRFAEPVYFLAKPIQWRPKQAGGKIPEVVVPAGFVTDLASIPHVFWSELKPGAGYAHAAIVLDFLYWEQGAAIARADADEIFRLALKDLDTAPATLDAISNALKTSGQAAWQQNAQLKAAGERRILKKPPGAAASWDDWKKLPGVF